jgi:hypothetical protein
MSTGDLHNNFERLRSEAKSTRYPHTLSFEKISTGEAKFLLPLLDHALVHYSRPVSEAALRAGCELMTASDARFVDLAFKACRLVLGCTPLLKPDQFLSPGFAERKIMCASNPLNCFKM